MIGGKVWKVWKVGSGERGKGGKVERWKGGKVEGVERGKVGKGGKGEGVKGGKVGRYSGKVERWKASLSQELCSTVKNINSPNDKVGTLSSRISASADLQSVLRFHGKDCNQRSSTNRR